ncbi:MAG: CRP/FNR family cyclic AMP-dependent transcriptional regulator [Litorivivens sp.]|jgi:CRP/FNR family cyclic AMP-dependent transcriptional regulator
MKRLETSFEKGLEILNKVHFFDQFSRTEKEVLAHSHFFLSQKDEVIINEGASDNSFYVLLTGKVLIQKKKAPKPLAVLLPGDCFGEISFLTERPRTTSVKAQVDCIFFEVNHSTLVFMHIDIREKLKDSLIHVLVKRLDDMNDLVSEMSISAIQAESNDTGDGLSWTQPL